MTILYPAQTPAISHRQSSTVSTTGLNQFAVFEVFKTSAGTQSGVNYTESNSTSHYQLRGNAGNTMILRVRMSGGNVTSSPIAISNDIEYKFLTTAEINNVSTSENVVRFYSGSGAQLGSDVSIDGQSYIVSTLQTRQNGDTVANLTRGPLYIWNGVMPDATTIAQAFAGVAPEDFDIPPTDIYKQNGTVGAHADTLADDGAPANDMIQIAGATSAPDWPTYLTSGSYEIAQGASTAAAETPTHTVTVAPYVSNIDGDGAIQDGQGTFTVSTKEFAAGVTSLVISDGTYSSANLFDSGSAGEWVGTATDLSNLVADTGPGIPNWFTGSLSLTATAGAESAADAIAWQPVAGWTVQAVSSASAAPGSIFEGRPTLPPDGSALYYPTAGNTSISASGVINTDLLQVDGILWDGTDGSMELFSFEILAHSVTQATSLGSSAAPAHDFTIRSYAVSQGVSAALSDAPAHDFTIRSYAVSQGVSAALSDAPAHDFTIRSYAVSQGVSAALSDAPAHAIVFGSQSVEQNTVAASASAPRHSLSLGPIRVAQVGVAVAANAPTHAVVFGREQITQQTASASAAVGRHAIVIGNPVRVSTFTIKWA